MTITLTLREAPSVPLEAEVLSPDVLAPLSLDEARALPIFLGKRQYRLEDFFTVEGKGLLVRPTYDEKVEDFIRPLFQQYYTMSFDNYPVEMERIEHPEVRACP